MRAGSAVAGRRMRAGASLGALLAAAVLSTAALSVIAIDVVAQMRAGADHEFDIQIAAREEAGTVESTSIPEWTPAPPEWSEANPEALEVGLAGSDADGGGDRSYAIAVRNTSPTLPAALCFTLEQDRQPSDSAAPPRAVLSGRDGALLTLPEEGSRRACAGSPLEPGEVRNFGLRVLSDEPAQLLGASGSPGSVVRLRVDGISR